jgi:hypothetical protein
METGGFGRIGLSVLAALAVAAVMAAEAVLRIGGRSAVIVVCLMAPAAWAIGLACSGRRLTPR